MKERVVVRIVEMTGELPVVMITVTGGRARQYDTITEASGYRLFQLCQKYRRDYSVYRDASLSQLKILLKEVR